MRTWRVGTFSMGLSLLFLGVFLLLSQILDWNITTALKLWWPVILVVLGLEILVYLFLSKQEKPYLNFDLFSIVIVGILGTAGVIMVFLQTSGVMDLIQDEIKKEAITLDLPAFNQDISKDIKRVVVEGDGIEQFRVEGINERNVSMFGTYRQDSTIEKIEKAEDYLTITDKGDTLYIRVKERPHQTGLYEDYSSLDATLLVPTDVQLELADLWSNISLNPRNLNSDWKIAGTGEIGLDIRETDNVRVSVQNTDIYNKEDQNWKFAKLDNDIDGNADSVSEVEVTTPNATLEKGKAENHIYVSNSDTLILNNMK
ncbi:hypothetical protein [Niallia sp. FSL R7-0271]|uniref:hypothetical protein n=1 Tax=Niallia sp. FSL R7-0271 TaxID=2921678 RepID=UPI0030F7564C